jgi:predicted Zn-dependent peptidase
VYVEPLGVSASPAGSIPAVFSSSIQRVAVPPDALERNIVPPGAETRTFRLPTGLEVVLATRRSAPLVAVTLTSRGGRADAEPLGSAELVQLGAWVRDRRGTFESSTGLLSSRWTERGSRVFQFRAANGNLENALAMLARTVESLRGGGGPDVGYHFWHKERLTKLFALPRQRAERELLRALYGLSPLGRVADPAELERLPNDGPGAWNERTLTPQNSVLVVSGDLVPSEAQAAVERQLGSWNRPGDPLGELPLPPGAEGAEPRIVKSARPGARLTEVTLACAVRIHSETERAALEVLGEDIRSRLHQTARTSLGASYGFGAQVKLERAVGELRVTGDVDERGLVRILALTRHEAGQLGAATLPADRFDLARWRRGIRTTAQFEHADILGQEIGADRLSGLPADARERYGATLGRLTPDEVTRAAAQCRRTAVVQLLGEPAVLERAVQSTGG